jgi:hypothetical protein
MLPFRFEFCVSKSISPVEWEFEAFIELELEIVAENSALIRISTSRILLSQIACLSSDSLSLNNFVPNFLPSRTSSVFASRRHTISNCNDAVAEETRALPRCARVASAARHRSSVLAFNASRSRAGMENT